MTHKVLIIGGGAGGVELACSLGRRSRNLDLEVALVDCAPLHFWKPRLHELAAGLQRASDAGVPYLALAQQNGFRFHLGSLTGLDQDRREVALGPVASASGRAFLDSRTVAYDTLVLAFGSEVNDFGTQGAKDYCFMLDEPDRAIVFQREVLEAAVLVSIGDADRLKIGIVGAGATGVELAAELCHSLGAMERSAGLMAASKLDITLIDMAPRVLANSAEPVSQFATKELKRLGVSLRLNVAVERVTSEGFFLNDGSMVACGLKVWASGVIGRSIASDLGLALDRSRRIVCDEFLRVSRGDHIYAMGDCACVADTRTKRALPTTAQVAHQQAMYLLERISRPDSTASKRPFEYHDKGSLVNLGAEKAAGELPMGGKGPLLTFNGIFPKLGYLMLQTMHRAALFGWRRTLTLTCADAIRRTATPHVKLH